MIEEDAKTEDSSREVTGFTAEVSCMFRLFVLGLSLSLVCGNASARSPIEKTTVPPVKAEGCGEFGTSIDFEDTPVEAAKKALKEEKLVFILHVSGHFEDPRFT
jgi:hypothetical protein